MIEVQNLTKTYGGTPAVDGLSFAVRPGRVTGFLGPNGAGKSTTMGIVTGLVRPDAGRALVDGVPYRRLREPLRSVGALLEARAVHGGRRAYDHLLWLARTHRIPRSRVTEVLRTVGLEGAARKRAGALSLGMGQRLGIAAALLGDPPVLLLDEPGNGLDPEGILWLRNLLTGLAAEGRTVFVSSHLMSEMALTAEHLIVVGRGRLLADTTVRAFVRDHARTYVRVRTPEPERMRQALADSGVQVETGAEGALRVEGATPERVGEVAAAHALTVYEVAEGAASLEEAFLRLTEGTAEHRASRTGYRAGEGAR